MLDSREGTQGKESSWEVKGVADFDLEVEAQEQKSQSQKHLSQGRRPQSPKVKNSNRKSRGSGLKMVTIQGRKGGNPRAALAF